MGYFCVASGESLEEKLEAAIANLELFKEDSSYPYLIDFALGYCKEALGLVIAKPEENSS